MQIPLKAVSCLMPKQHILLLSHMRANTSLISHIIGSHQQISGYYEMHIGYYSWKSLLNQQIRFISEHTDLPLTRFYFDKVLHSDHAIKPRMLSHPRVKLIFSIRNPQSTIQSIVRLYQKNEPENVLATPAGAMAYYNQRLLDLASLAQSIPKSQSFLYYDAEAIVDSSDDVLSHLQRFIGVNVPFSENYQVFNKSGQAKYGDSSEHILSGAIVQPKEKPAVALDPECLQESEAIYQRVRDELRANALPW